MRKVYTTNEVAAALHRAPRWVRAWLNDNPTDAAGVPFGWHIGRDRRFDGDDIVRLIDAILTWEEAIRPPLSGNGFIYFIDGGEHIKIGFTRSLDARLQKMGTDVPDGPKLLHFEPGTFKTEKMLHRHFASLRMRGEWFRKDPLIYAHIEQRKLIGAGP